MTKCYISTILYGNENYQMIYDTLRLTNTKIGIEYFVMEVNHNEFQQLRKLKEVFGNLLATVHSPMRNAEPTSLVGTKENEMLFANWEETLKLCLELKAKQIVFHTNNCYINQNERLEKQKNAIENCLKLNELCKKYHVTLLIETLALPSKGAPIFTDQEFVDFIIKNDLSVLVDVGHMNINGYDYQYVIKTLKNRIKAYHIHNNNGFEDSHQGIKDGTFDYHLFIEMYKKYTPEADLIFEYIDIPNLQAQQLASDIDWLFNNTR